MSAPKPAEPRDETATIVWRSEVPVGWELRTTHPDSFAPAMAWHQDWDYLVEARPPAPKTVMVDVPESWARYMVAGQPYDNDLPFDIDDVITAACAKALETDQ